MATNTDSERAMSKMERAEKSRVQRIQARASHYCGHINFSPKKVVEIRLKECNSLRVLRVNTGSHDLDAFNKFKLSFMDIDRLEIAMTGLGNHAHVYECPGALYPEVSKLRENCVYCYLDGIPFEKSIFEWENILDDMHQFDLRITVEKGYNNEKDLKAFRVTMTFLVASDPLVIAQGYVTKHIITWVHLFYTTLDSDEMYESIQCTSGEDELMFSLTV